MRRFVVTPAFTALCFAALPLAPAAAPDLPGSRNARVTQVYERALPDVPGKSIRGALGASGPGGHSPSHRHAKSAIIDATVLKGAARSQINGGPVQTFQAGQHVTELPGDHHTISGNASDTRPAKLLAVFVVDTADTELTIPDPR